VSRSKWRRVLREEERIPEPEKLNKELFPSYAAPLEVDVVNLIMTGTTANTFYVKGEKLAEEMIDAFTRMAQKDPVFLAKTIVYGREVGFRKEPPFVALAVLSKYSPELFKKIVHRVLQTPSDWRFFVDICRSRKIRKGVGRMIKREMITALKNMPAYQAVKYRSAVIDMVRIARPREDVNPAVIKYAMEGRLEGDPLFEAIAELRRMVREGASDEKIAELIEERRIPFEFVVGNAKVTPAVAAALLRFAPWTNLLLNIVNYAEWGAFDHDPSLVDAVARRLEDPGAIRKAKVLPTRLYVALREAENSWSVPERVKRALERALELSVENIPALPGKVAVAADVSDSMNTRLLSDKSNVTAAEVAGLFASLLLWKQRGDVILLPFRDEVVPEIAAKARTAERLVDAVKAFYPSGGTSLSAPVRYLIESREGVDYFIGITDNEEWVGEPFVRAWAEYKVSVSPGAKAVLITLLPYRDYPVPQGFKDVRLVFGWSDAVLRYVFTDPAKQLEEVKAVEV